MAVIRETWKTANMLAMEENRGGPMEEWLPSLINEVGLFEAEKQLGVSRMTMYSYLGRLRIRLETVALGPNDTLEIKKAG
jgi:hypothetical protein